MHSSAAVRTKARRIPTKRAQWSFGRNIRTFRTNGSHLVREIPKQLRLPSVTAAMALKTYIPANLSSPANRSRSLANPRLKALFTVPNGASSCSATSRRVNP